MILGYVCEGCKGVADEVTKCVVLVSDRSAPLISQYRCEECVNKFVAEFEGLGFDKELLQITTEKKVGNVMGIVVRKTISRMGR